MKDYLQNIHDLEYYNEAQLAAGLITKWVKQSPNNKELKAISKSMSKMMFYVVRLQQDSLGKDQMISDLRFKRNKALLRLQEIKEQNKTTELKQI
tara:strand:- start:9613 stop:9897 length:285 start_codon:yes stop_codon:yes gene_type:complete